MPKKSVSLDEAIPAQRIMRSYSFTLEVKALLSLLQAGQGFVEETGVTPQQDMNDHSKNITYTLYFVILTNTIVYNI